MGERRLFGVPHREVVEIVMHGVRRAKADPRSLRITPGIRQNIVTRREDTTDDR